MFVDRQQIDLLNRLIDARVDLAAYAQLRKAKRYIPINENSYLRDNSFRLSRELHDKLLRLSLHLDQEEWNALRHAEEALATAAICLMSRHRDCPIIITVNTDKLEDCLASLTLDTRNLQRHAIFEKARKLRGRKCLPLHVQAFVKMNLLPPSLTTF